MSDSKFQLLAGLGNPGSSYQNTRHNVGFMALEKLARNNDSIFKINKKIYGHIADIGNGKNKKRLLMPNTFMNESGKSIKAAMNWFGIEASKILIIGDDMDLPLGKLRIRSQGSSGGHNGLNSIIDNLGTTNFCRLKIGIGHPTCIARIQKTKTVSHVLGKFNSNELKVIETVLEVVIKGLDLIEKSGIAEGTTYLNSYKYQEII